jgi:hypothetical protein
MTQSSLRDLAQDKFGRVAHPRRARAGLRPQLRPAERRDHLRRRAAGEDLRRELSSMRTTSTSTWRSRTGAADAEGPAVPGDDRAQAGGARRDRSSGGCWRSSASGIGLAASRRTPRTLTAMAGHVIVLGNTYDLLGEGERFNYACLQERATCRASWTTEPKYLEYQRQELLARTRARRDRRGTVTVSEGELRAEYDKRSEPAVAALRPLRGPLRRPGRPVGGGADEAMWRSTRRSWSSSSRPRGSRFTKLPKQVRLRHPGAEAAAAGRGRGQGDEGRTQALKPRGRRSRRRRRG